MKVGEAVGVGTVSYFGQKKVVWNGAPASNFLGVLLFLKIGCTLSLPLGFVLDFLFF